jgi:hypothetical protein
MHIRHTTIFFIVTLLSFGLTATSQTKPNTTNPPPRKLSPAVEKTIPAIKCTDADSMTACKSFKQLLDSRDKRVLTAVMGKHTNKQRHYAYVCPRPKTDVFQIVYFDMPNEREYKGASYYSDSGSYRTSLKLSAFLGASTPNHPVDPSIQDEWLDQHLDFEEYVLDDVTIEEYKNGLFEDIAYDFGKWSRPSEDSPARGAEATFEGAYVWLARHTGIDKDAPDIGDDPEHAHITIGSSTIYVHYRFQNKNGGNTDYRLNIQESTGRFTETYSISDMDATEHSGACMIFKQ